MSNTESFLWTTSKNNNFLDETARRIRAEIENWKEIAVCKMKTESQLAIEEYFKCESEQLHNFALEHSFVAVFSGAFNFSLE